MIVVTCTLIFMLYSVFILQPILRPECKLCMCVCRTYLGCLFTETFSPEFISQCYYHLLFSCVYTKTLSLSHRNIRFVTNHSAMNKMAIRHGKQQQSFDVLAWIRCCNASITYRSHRNVRSVTYHQRQTTGFLSVGDNEVELLLTSNGTNFAWPGEYCETFLELQQLMAESHQLLCQMFLAWHLKDPMTLRVTLTERKRRANSHQIQMV